MNKKYIERSFTLHMLGIPLENDTQEILNKISYLINFKSLTVKQGYFYNETDYSGKLFMNNNKPVLFLNEVDNSIWLSSDVYYTIYTNVLETYDLDYESLDFIILLYIEQEMNIKTEKVPIHLITNKMENKFTYT